MSVASCSRASACAGWRCVNRARSFGPAADATNVVDECGVCKAIVSDIFGTVRFSRERPTSSKPNKRESRDDNYFRLLGHMSRVCDDLPFRHAFRAEEKDAVSEMCEDIWDEHESTFQSLALKRKPDFAAAVCSSGLDICEDDMTDGELYAHDPGASRSKDEL